MRLNYEFAKLCGRSYTDGNLVFTPDGNSVLSCVSNRVMQFNLTMHKTNTLTPQNRFNIVAQDLSPSGTTLITVDEKGSGLLINFYKKVALCFIQFRNLVTCLKFSPDSKLVAVAEGKRLRVFKAPGLIREVHMFDEVAEFAGIYDDITCISWSLNSQYIATGSKDLIVRVFSINSDHSLNKVHLTGARTPIVGVHFADDETVYGIAQDASVYIWKLLYDEELKKLTATRVKIVNLERKFAEDSKGKFALVKCVAFHNGRKNLLGELNAMMVVGYSSGVFSIIMLPDFEEVHSLSISNNEISSVAINNSGEWLAFGSPLLGQLLVWEWKSETYILKQQGHYHDLESTAYSKDGQLLATGGSDGKIKLWNYDTGYCFVTFSDHIAPVTGVTFTSRGNVVLSSSLDGSVRAYDLVRYRNFRTLTPPDEEVIGSVQLTCIASDPSGDIICAGAMDPFNIYVWSLRTSKLLDILKGHEGPISSVAFSASRNLLISASWDKTVRVWDVYSSKNSTERFEHNSDVLAVCVNPQGTQICSATLDGQLFFWNIVDGTLEGTIDGSKDIMGGRKQTDARASTNSTWGDHFTTVSYSPDGSIVIAGGNSKFVCMYEVTQRILVKKFEITSNRSLDGVLDKLDSRNMTEAGIPKQLINDDEEEKFNNFEQLLELKRSMPGVQFGDYSSRKHIPKAIQSKQVCFSPSGESWAVASTEGLMIFSQNSEATFDPISLDLEITPDNIELAFKQHEFSKALLMSLRLNEKEYILNILEHCPPSEIPLIIRSVPVNFLYKLVEILAEIISSTKYLEYYMIWCQNLLNLHGAYLKKNSNTYASALRLLQKSIMVHSSGLLELCQSNRYNLEFLVLQSQNQAIKSSLHSEEEEEQDIDQESNLSTNPQLKKQKV